MWTPDYEGERRIAHRPVADDAASAEGLRGLLGVPLAVRGRVIGALLAAKRTERHFTDDEIIDWLHRVDDSLPGSPIEALRANRGSEVKRRAQVAGY